jgi:CRP-like cAMP-binding protein
MAFDPNEISFARCGKPVTVGRIRSGVSEHTFRDLSNFMEKRRYKKGQTIISQDSVPDEIIVIKKGTAELHYRNKEEKDRVAMIGEIFGFTESMAASPFRHGLTARTACQAEVMRRDDLIAYLRRSPEACFASLLLVADNLRSARDAVLTGNSSRHVT